MAPATPSDSPDSRAFCCYHVHVRQIKKTVVPLVDFSSDVMTILASKLKKNYGPLQSSDRLDELGLDSLEIFELTSDLEEKFDILISYDDNSQLEPQTIADLVEHVRQLVAAKRPAKLA